MLQKPSKVFIASSTLHVINSIALTNKSEGKFNNILWLFETNQNCFSLAKELRNTKIFDEVNVFINNRKKNFEEIKEKLATLNISHLFIGNDRLVEFQYIANYLKKAINFQKCIYVDEGLYTYTGRPLSLKFSEKIIDNFLKKIFYGFWWSSPQTIGASKYIDEIYAYFPAYIHKDLKNSKAQVKILDRNLYLQKKFIRQLQFLFKNYSDTFRKIQQTEAIYYIPDEKDVSLIPNYRSKLINHMKLNKKNIVKYHPNSTSEDILNLQNLDTDIIPTEIPAEVISIFLKNTKVFANNGTAHIMTKMINPKLKVFNLSFSNSKSVDNANIHSLLHIPTINI